MYEPMQQEDFVQLACVNGIYCPHCYSNAQIAVDPPIAIYSSFHKASIVEEEAECLECLTKWTNIYKLDSYRHLSTDEPIYEGDLW